MTTDPAIAAPPSARDPRLSGVTGNMPRESSASSGRPAIVADGLRNAPLLAGAVAGTLLGTTPTLGAVFGIFLVPIATEFGWSRTQVAGAFSAMAVAAMIFYPVAGRLADRFGTRAVLLAGFALQGVFTLALSRLIPNAALYYPAFALAGAAGALSSNMVIAKLLSQRFDRGRGFWMGLVGGIGNGVGSILLPILAASLLVGHGWRGTFVIIGCIVLLVGLPIIWLTMKEPASRPPAAGEPVAAILSPPEIGLGEALRRPLFWVIFSAVPIGGGFLTGVFMNVAPMLQQRGVSLEQATSVIALFAAVTVLWEPLVGYMLDRTSRPRCVAPFYFLAVAGLLILANATHFGVLLLGGGLAGIGLGAEFSVLPYVLSRYFGLGAMGAISGVAFAGVLGATALAPMLLNGGFDMLGSYKPGVYVVAGCILYTATVFLFLDTYPDRPGEDAAA
ncbi:MFS transporter [Sphingomonas bacterium]|uniref:MFS transporter n=1 Tax=Sphingomonas bacterium TaxID=1895847 RepID=UPI001575AA1D|nr:MFS transporter [Sphingomonas bacterium]